MTSGTLGRYLFLGMAQQTPEKPAVVVTETEARAVAAAAQARRRSFLVLGHLNHIANKLAVGLEQSEGMVFCGNVFNDEPLVPCGHCGGTPE